MQYEEFKRHVGRAGLTVTSFAALLGRSRASVTNYGLAGVVPGHIGLIAVLMADLADARVDFAPSVARLGLSKKLCRGRGFTSKAAATSEQ